MKYLPRLAFVSSILVGLSACSSASSDPASAESEVTGGSSGAEACTTKIEESALAKAREIDESAHVVSTVSLYGNEDTYADAVLVRISDEVEPSDYLVVRSRIRDGVVDAKECSVASTTMVVTGLTPGDELVKGGIGAGCQASIEQAVLAEATKLNEEAQVTGTKLVYGGDHYFGGAALVRVSDETEPSHYLAVFGLSGSQEADAGTCTVELVHIMASGLLPEIEGLE
jgi:hypothetical protein